MAQPTARTPDCDPPQSPHPSNPSRTFRWRSLAPGCTGPRGLSAPIPETPPPPRRLTPPAPAPVAFVNPRVYGNLCARRWDKRGGGTAPGGPGARGTFAGALTWGYAWGWVGCSWAPTPPLLSQAACPAMGHPPDPPMGRTWGGTRAGHARTAHSLCVHKAIMARVGTAGPPSPGEHPLWLRACWVSQVVMPRGGARHQASTGRWGQAWYLHWQGDLTAQDTST